MGRDVDISEAMPGWVGWAGPVRSRTSDPRLFGGEVRSRGDTFLEPGLAVDRLIWSLDSCVLVTHSQRQVPPSSFPSLFEIR